MTSVPGFPFLTTSSLALDQQEDGCLEQCGDWAFVAELVQDVLADHQKTINDLKSALDADDHSVRRPLSNRVPHFPSCVNQSFSKVAHSVKGAALNLHLTALAQASKTAEMLGKQLVQTPTDAALLAQRQSSIDAMDHEYSRLQDLLPEIQALAEEEAAGQ